MPRFLLDDIKKLDGRDDYRNYDFTPEEKEELARYIELLPPRYKEVMRKRLIGIYAVSPFMGAGLADWVMDDSGTIYAILVINPDVMKKTLSEWLTLRERSCFYDDDSKTALHVNAGKRYSALMYVLLHEAAHIVDYVEHHTPYVEPPLSQISNFTVKDKPFVKDIWEDYAKPAHLYEFPMRADITFYGLSKGPKIPLSKAKDLYDGFSKSAFASLYATQNWAEDFADTAMLYHLAKKLGESYEIIITKNGREEMRLHPSALQNIKKRFDYMRNLY